MKELLSSGILQLVAQKAYVVPCGKRQIEKHFHESIDAIRDVTDLGTLMACHTQRKVQSLRLPLCERHKVVYA